MNQITLLERIVSGFSSICFAIMSCMLFYAGLAGYTSYKLLGLAVVIFGSAVFFAYVAIANK